MSLKRKKELEDLVIYHKQKYYKGEVEISDEHFDKLEDELKALDPDSYALALVGFEVMEDKIKHDKPMLSLSKSREIPDVTSWMEGEKCFVTYKMDGSSASLIYDKGIFKIGKTRGDGVYGENLTKYFKYINIPKELKSKELKGKDLEIRGEVCITKNNFDDLCVEMEKRKLSKPKSIRNIVAGLLHKKTDLDLCKYLDFIGYEIFCEDSDIKTEKEKISVLNSEKFVTPLFCMVENEDDVTKFIEGYAEAIEKYEFLTDGLVFSIDSIESQVGRGFTGHHPKGKLAYKFKSDTAFTKVKDIIVDVGRTGKITFVGIVEPVELSGATVQRVTFHNVKYIADNDLNIGCEIEITRSGEVIPKHERTIKKNGIYEAPKVCPICNTEVKMNETEVDLFCYNPMCKSKLYGQIANWIKTTGIENIGDGTLGKLYEENIVTDIKSLYTLKESDISGLEKLGEKSAKKIVENIQNSKKMDIVTFLKGLGIEGLGRGVSKLIVEEMRTLDAIKKMKYEDFVSIKGIGEILAEQIINGLNDHGWTMLSELQELGIEVEDMPEQSDEDAGDLAFSGKTFVITGKLSKPRKEIETFIEDRGGKSTKTVSKNTSFLVCNEKSSSSKYVKAEKLGVQIITEDQLSEM